jgi:hypothetical protein
MKKIELHSLRLLTEHEKKQLYSMKLVYHESGGNHEVSLHELSIHTLNLHIVPYILIYHYALQMSETPFYGILLDHQYKCLFISKC